MHLYYVSYAYIRQIYLNNLIKMLIYMEKNNTLGRNEKSKLEGPRLPRLLKSLH